MASDTWASRELPALEYLVTHFDEHPERQVQLGALEAQLGSREAAVGAVKALTSPDEPYLVWQDATSDARFDCIIDGVTPAARRAVDSWPTTDTARERLTGAIEQHLASASGDERKRLQRLLNDVGAVGKSTMAAILAAVLTGQA